jgi:hypothetical protein
LTWIKSLSFLAYELLENYTIHGMTDRRESIEKKKHFLLFPIICFITDRRMRLQRCSSHKIANIEETGDVIFENIICGISTLFETSVNS